MSQNQNRYCEKCGIKLVIKSLNKSKIKYHDPYTGEPYWEIKAVMICPNRKYFFDKHSLINGYINRQGLFSTHWYEI